MYAKDIIRAVFDGIISIPSDLGYGAWRTFEDLGGSGNATRLGNVAENKRVALIIGNALKFTESKSGVIYRTLKIILEEFYKDLPDSVIDKVAKKAGIGSTYMTSRIATQAILIDVVAKKLVTQIATKVIAKRIAKIGVGFVLGVLIIQGMIEKASNSAKKLRQTHPYIYHKLKGLNIDMAYFLIEDSMAKTMEAIIIKSTNPEKFNKLLKEIENEILSN